MSTTKEARDALEKMASVDVSDAAAGIRWLEGVEAHCKEAGLDTDQVLDAINPGILKESYKPWLSAKMRKAGLGKKQGPMPGKPGVKLPPKPGKDTFGLKAAAEQGEGSRVDALKVKLSKQSQATREQLAAGAAKNAKKKTAKAPQLDQGAAQAAETLS